MKRTALRPAFTLIELIIYVALTAIVVVALTNVMLAVLGAREQAEGTGDLRYALRFSMDRLVTDTLRAQGVHAQDSVFGSDAGRVVLRTGPEENDTVTYALENDRLVVQEEDEAVHPLTPPEIVMERFHVRRETNTGSSLLHILLHGRTAGIRDSATGSLTLRTAVTLPAP